MMALNKIGTPVPIKVIKESAFAMDVNVLASLIEKQWPKKEVSLDQLHEAIKHLGILDYSSEDMNQLVGRLQAIGFSISK
jgi:hypothetical protein